MKRYIMKRTYIKYIFLLGVAIGLCVVGHHLKNRNIENKYNAADCSKDAIVLRSSDMIILDSGNTLTCTGMSYDSEKERYYIGNYGKAFVDDKEQNASIIVCDKDFTIVEEIGLPDTIKNIQGVTYCNSIDSIAFTDTIYIYIIDMYGDVKSSFTLGEYNKYLPNSVLYDDRDNTLWVLCYWNYLLHIDMQGNIIDTIDCSYKDQDQICFDENYNILFTVGADYNGDNNYIGIVDTVEKSSKIMYKAVEAYAIEGIYKNDGTIYVVNDGIYHDAKIDENYVIKYEVD